MRIIQRWKPRPEIIASRYRKAFVSAGANIELGMLELKGAVEATFIPAFKELTPRGKEGDAGKLAESTQVTEFVVDGLASYIKVGQTATNERGVPYWTFVEGGRAGMTLSLDLGTTPGAFVIPGNDPGHPFNTMAAVQENPYIQQATDAGTAALRPALQVIVQNMLGRMVKDWVRGI